MIKLEISDFISLDGTQLHWNFVTYLKYPSSLIYFSSSPVIVVIRFSYYSGTELKSHTSFLSVIEFLNISIFSILLISIEISFMCFHNWQISKFLDIEVK